MTNVAQQLVALSGRIAAVARQVATHRHHASAIESTAAGAVSATDVDAAIAQLAALAGGGTLYAGMGADWWLPAPAPTGWALLDGSPLVTDCEYRDLLIAAGNPFGASGGNPLLPDSRDRVVVGVGNMGGADADRITTGSTALGGTGGVETVTLALSEIPTHDHGGETSADTVTFGDFNTGARNAFTTGITTSTASTGITAATSSTGLAGTAAPNAHTHASGTYATVGDSTGNKNSGTTLTNTTVGGTGERVNATHGHSIPALDVNGTSDANSGSGIALGHSHTIAVTDPQHSHATTAATLNTAGNLAHTHAISGADLVAAQTAHAHAIDPEGGGDAHENLQPYIAANRMVYLGEIA